MALIEAGGAGPAAALNVKIGGAENEGAAAAEADAAATGATKADNGALILVGAPNDGAPNDGAPAALDHERVENGFLVAPIEGVVGEAEPKRNEGAALGLRA